MYRTPEQEANIEEYRKAAEQCVLDRKSDTDVFSFARGRVLEMLTKLKPPALDRICVFLIDNKLQEKLCTTSLVLTDSTTGHSVTFFDCIEAYLFIRLIDETQEVRDVIGA